MSAMIRAAYERVSTEEQAEAGHSIQVQSGITVKYFFHTFGCRVNQYETQVIRERISADQAVHAVSDWEDADVCVVNTCTVTDKADRDALALIRRIARRNPAARLVVTGCLATRDPEAVLAAAPAAVVAGNSKKEILPALLGCAAGPAFAGISGFHGRERAFVKVQDGCDMRCSYCVIPSVRPKRASRPPGEVEREVRGLVAGGAAEVVLCGVRLGRYLSSDGGRRVDFTALLERLLALPGDFRIRLSSLEVTDLTDRFLESAARGAKLCPSFHIPLQSGSDTVLRRMRRWYTTGFYEERLRALREKLPDAGIFSDILVGFPGETDGEFEGTLEFVERLGLSGLHVFRYSRRVGTPAATFRTQVPGRVLLQRVERMRALDRRLRSAFARQAVGSDTTVLIERKPTGYWGCTEHFLRVRFSGAPGTGLVRARIVSVDGPDAFAEPLLDHNLVPKA